MTQRDTKIPGHPEGLPPETDNSEQDASGEQAQDVANDARAEDSHTSSRSKAPSPRRTISTPRPPTPPI